MFAPIRFLMTAIGLVLIGITLCAFVFSGHLEHWGRLWLEDTLSHSYGTRVEIARLSIAPLEFGAVAEEVHIYNPEGFEPGVAIAIDRVLLRPDFRTLFTERPTLDFVELDNVEVKQEQFFKNVRTITENARIAIETGDGPRLQVRQVAITGGQLKGLVPVKLRGFESKRVEEGMPLEGPELEAELAKNIMLNVITLNGALEGDSAG